MALLTNTCEGTNGVAVTTANTAGPDQFSSVLVQGGSSIVFDNAHAHTGSTSLRIAKVGQTWEIVRWTGSYGTGTLYMRGYYYLTAYPTTDWTTLMRPTGGSDPWNAGAYCMIRPNGYLSIASAWDWEPPSQQGATQMPLNQWVRVEFDHPWNGVPVLRQYSGANLDGATPDWTLTHYQAESVTSGSSWSGGWFGGMDLHAESLTYWVDGVALSDAPLAAPTSPSSIKFINGLAKANVKTINGLPIASVKTWNGLS